MEEKVEKIQVSLLRYTPEPEAAIALAARLCYSDKFPDDLAAVLKKDEIDRLVAMLRDLGHETPFEHAVFSFGISGISRSLSHQLVRHRIASYSQHSQRYVAEREFSYIMPPSVRDNEEACRTYAAAMEDIRKAYSRLIDLGLPREDARYVLPNACNTAIVVTMNARSLFHFFRLRCCNRAQWEIRVLAYRMLRLARGVSPLLFGNSGPPCVTEDNCPEGSMSCGKIQRLRDGKGHDE